MTNSKQPNAASSASDRSVENQNNNVIGEGGKKEPDADNIYLDLDTILDTRMGTLSKMNSDYPVSVLNSGNYHRRLSDEFEVTSLEEFREAYAQRDLDTLKRSVLTNVVFFLRRLIKDSLVSAVINQHVEKLCFTVNVYPYDFTDPDLVDMLVGCIMFHTYASSTVQIVSISNEELTPEHCEKNYQIMLRYHWVDWVDKHKEYFEQRGIPGVTLVVPELFYEGVPTSDDIESLDLKKQNPFHMVEAVTAPLFRLKHMPASLFSIHEGITKDNAGDLSRKISVTQQDIEEYLNKKHPNASLVQDTPLPAADLSEAFDLL